MIRARFFSVDGSVLGFKISGHAGFADAGSDIVCAGVSSAVQMTANTITEIIGEKADVKSSGNEISLMLFRQGGEKHAEAQNIIKGLRMQLSILSEQFEGTISIEDSEV